MAEWLEEKRAEEVAEKARKKVCGLMTCTPPDTLPTSLSFVNRVHHLVVCRLKLLLHHRTPPPLSQQGGPLTHLTHCEYEISMK